MNEQSVSTEKIWHALSGKLRGFLKQRVSDEQVAEDLLQETFIRVHKRLNALKDSDRITSWVFQIARNLLVDHYRSRGRSQPATITPPEDEQAEENLNERVMDWFPEMIAELPDAYREAVELYELKGVPQQEIAQRLGISLSGAKSRVQRGRAKLKSILLECCSFDRDRRGNIIGYRKNKVDDPCRECDASSIDGVRRP